MNKYSFSEIIGQSVIKEANDCWRGLGQFDDPRIEYFERSIDLLFDVPHYEKALEWYYECYPYEKESEYTPYLVRRAYSWMMDGFKREVRLEKSEREIRALQAQFHEWQPLTELYNSTVERLDSLPDEIKRYYLTQVEFYRDAACAASKIIVEGEKVINECIADIQSNNLNNQLLIDQLRLLIPNSPNNGIENGNNTSEIVSGPHKEADESLQSYGEFGDKKPEVRQVALLYAYKGEVIDAENCTGVAKKYGYKSGTSGQYLHSVFKTVKKATDRVGFKSEPKRRADALIADIGIILTYLTDIQRTKAESEIAEIEKEICKYL